MKTLLERRAAYNRARSNTFPSQAFKWWAIGWAVGFMMALGWIGANTFCH